MTNFHFYCFSQLKKLSLNTSSIKWSDSFLFRYIKKERACC